jgi:hypothetical protein
VYLCVLEAVNQINVLFLINVMKVNVEKVSIILSLISYVLVVPLIANLVLTGPSVKEVVWKTISGVPQQNHVFISVMLPTVNNVINQITVWNATINTIYISLAKTNGTVLTTISVTPNSVLHVILKSRLISVPNVKKIKTDP